MLLAERAVQVEAHELVRGDERHHRARFARRGRGKGVRVDAVEPTVARVARLGDGHRARHAANDVRRRREYQPRDATVPQAHRNHDAS